MEGADGVATPVRIAYVIDSFESPAGGTESQLVTLVRGLDRRRYEPRVYLLREPDALTAAIPDVRVETLHIGPLAHPRALAHLGVFVRRLRGDGAKLVHLYFNDTSIVLPWLLRIAGMSVVVSRRDLGYWHTPGVLRVLRVQRAAVAAVVANCSAVRDRVIAAEGFEPTTVHVIHNGQDISPLPWTRADARNLLGLNPNAPVLLMVANLRPLKCAEDVVAALPAIRAQFPDTQLVLVGCDSEGRAGPSYVAELRDLARQLSVASGLRIVGDAVGPRPFIAAADVCLLCSETEGLSNAIIEYMLGERPSVCTRVGGNPELLEDGVTGTLVAVGQPAEIASAVLGYLGNPERASRVGVLARASAVGRFSTQRMVDAHQALYDKVLRAHHRSRA